MAPVGERIARRRRQLGWTQERLAETVECSKAAICRYESGKRAPTLAMLEKIAGVLGLTLAGLCRAPSGSEAGAA